MQLSPTFVISMVLGASLVACGDDGGKGGGVDAAKGIDAPMIDAPPAALTGLGQKCVAAMAGADCPADAPVCTGFTGTTTYCTPRCVTAGTATGAANNQFTGITPAPSDAACTAAFHATVGMPKCVGILNNFMPADNPIVAGKAYTNINMTCAVLCGTGNTCPTGMTMNTSLGACACFPN